MLFSNLFSRYNSRHLNDISAKNKDFAHTENTKGITLVALVVTIIVLLILAGVTIMTLFGENGLISMADKAKTETENAQANDITGIENLINEMNSVLIENGNSGGDYATAGATFSKYLTNPGCHASKWNHTDSCYTNQENTLTWEELKLAENGEKYVYNATEITDTSIGDNAFYCNNYLTSISIPDGVTSIGEEAFYSCDSFTSIGPVGSGASVEISNSVTSIGYSTFGSCDSLTSITIPDGVTSIGDNAFEECDALINLTIPDSVTSIGKGAFSTCPFLTSVTIGNGATSIDDSAFSDCTSLTSINYNGTKTEWNAITKEIGWKYNVPATQVVCSDGVIAIADAG